MGSKLTRSLCCTNEAREEQLDYVNNRRVNDNKNNAKHISSNVFKSTAEHYSSVDDSLANPSSTNAKNSTQASNSPSIYPLFFDFDKGFLRFASSKEPLSISNGNYNTSDETSLVESIMEFFDERIYEVPLSKASTLSSIDCQRENSSSQNSYNHMSSIMGQTGQFERCYVDSKKPSNLTIFLRREQSGQSKYHSSVSESVFENVASIDSFLLTTGMKLYHEALDNSIESQKILYQQIIREGVQVQIVYTIFKRMHYPRQRELIYMKVIQRVDANTCVIAASSVSLQSSQCLLIDSELTEGNSMSREASIASQSGPLINKKSMRFSKPPIRKMSNEVAEKLERAELGLSGQKITFDPLRNVISMQELQKLDMKIDASHYIQKELQVYQQKQLFADLTKALAELNVKTGVASKN